MKNLKLFLWTDVLWDYTNGIAFALATNVEDARKLIISEYEETHSKDSARFAAELEAEAPEIIDKQFGFYHFGGA